MDIATIKEEIDKRVKTKKERAIELRDKIIDQLSRKKMIKSGLTTL